MSVEKPVYDKKLYEDFFKGQIILHKRKVDNDVENTRGAILVFFILTVICFGVRLPSLGYASASLTCAFLFHQSYLQDSYDLPYKPGFKKRVLEDDKSIPEWTRAWKQYLLDKNLFDLDA